MKQPFSQGTSALVLPLKAGFVDCVQVRNWVQSWLQVNTDAMSVELEGSSSQATRNKPARHVSRARPLERRSRFSILKDPPGRVGQMKTRERSEGLEAANVLRLGP